MTTVVAAAATAMEGGGEDNGRCELLGPFALFVQGALGALALLSLVWKRSRESPQRPILIWWFDVSKQVLGSVLVHMANLLLSMLSSGTFTTEPSPSSLETIYRKIRRTESGPPDPEGVDNYHANPCSFYLLNLAIDTTLGIAILIYILRLLNTLLLMSPFQFFKTGINSGDYGNPPKWSYWIKQTIIYFMGLMGMKFVVWIIFALCPWLGRVGDWLLAWTEGDRRLQVFFVMFFFPLVMNAVQYYIIDSYIKNQDPNRTDLEDSTLPDGPLSTRRPFNDSEDVFSSSSEDDDINSRGRLQAHRRSRTNNKASTSLLDEYNPETDGSTLLDGQVTPSSSPSGSGSFMALRGGRRAGGLKGFSGSSKSRNSSMMLLPGSRGPSTPGYGEDESFRGRRESGEDDETTLVGREEDVEARRNSG
ncbi:hypothetical protein RUND412_006743 [Rhizina undulata]